VGKGVRSSRKDKEDSSEGWGGGVEIKEIFDLRFLERERGESMGRGELGVSTKKKKKKKGQY